MDQPAIIVPFAGGYGRDRLGDECPWLLGPCSIARLDAAAEFFRVRNHEDDIIVASAGRRADVNPQYPTLARLMLEYLAVKRGLNPQRIACAADSTIWRTLGEMRFAFALQQKHPRHKLVFVSDACHLPRIYIMSRVLARRYGCRTAHLHYVRARDNHVTAYRLCYEPLALGKFIVCDVLFGAR